MRVRVEVDGEPLAPGTAVSGRGVVEEGGRARSLSVRLAFSLPLPDDAAPNIATGYGRIGWELGARVDRAGPDPTVDRPIELLRSYTAPDRERWPSG